MIRFQFVDDHRTEYSVKRMCHVLKLNRSSFYKWVQTREKRRLKMCSDALIGAKSRPPSMMSTGFMVLNA
ncbi:hypothetical protein ACOI9B_13495, partial [Corynebacterium striatum]